MLDATDPALISTHAFTSIQTAASNISSNPLAALQSADTYADTLLDAIALLPVARGRDVEQQVKDAAANFQRSASQRLNALSEDVNAAAKRLQSFRTEVDERAADLKAQIEEQATAFDTKLAEVEQTIATQRQALDEQMTRQGKAFTETQEERSTEFQEALEAFRTDLARTQKRATEEVDQRVAEIRRMEEESSNLVGAIGLAGTAERYSEERKEQRITAELLRALAVLAAVGAIVAAVFATVEENPTAESLIARLSVSVLAAGIAAYLARQSARHRAREEHARALQLELTAFGPFIEPLSAEQKEEERVIMTRKTFGKTTPPGKSEEEPGPAPLSFLLQRRRKQEGFHEEEA